MVGESAKKFRQRSTGMAARRAAVTWVAAT